MRNRISGWVAAGILLAAAFAANADASATISGSAREALRDAFASCRNGEEVLLVAPGLNFYPLMKEGELSGRIVQLTPGTAALRNVQFESWKASLPVPADNAAFAGGRITARFGNTEVAVVALPSLGSPPGKIGAVILDPSFFPTLYENEVRGGMIDLSLKLYKTLSDRKVSTSPLFVIDPLSVSSVPLHWAYLGELWREIWTSPESFRDDMPARWKSRKNSEFVAEFGQFEEAAALLEEVRPAFPKDGSVDYQLARLAFWDKEIPEGVRHLNRATKADRRFLRGFAEYAAYLVSKERLPAAEVVLRAGLLIDPSDGTLNAAMLKHLLERSGDLREFDPEGAAAALEEAAKLSIPEDRKKGIREMIDRMKQERPADGSAPPP